MTVDRADLIELFGEERLVTVEPAAIAGLGLGTAAMRVLTDVGLPAAPPLLSVTPPAPVDGYVRFGHLWEDAFDACVDPRTEIVVGRAGRDEVFVSSSVDLFVETLYLVYRTAREHVDADDEEFQRAADELHDRLLSLDPPAMADDGWWASVVQEMRLGM